MKPLPALALSAWLAQRADDSDRLRPFGMDPDDDLLEQRANAEAQADRAFDHTPILR